MGQIQFTVSLVMIGLFTIAIIGFAMSFANNNTVYVDINDDPELAELFTNVSSNSATFADASGNTYDLIGSSTIGAGDTTTTSGGQFKITPGSLISSMTSILKTGYVKIFGNGSGFGIFITTFISIIIFIIGLLIWKTWAGKIPD